VKPRRKPEPRTCPTCQGSGWLWPDPPSPSDQARMCPACRGTGRPTVPADHHPANDPTREDT